MWEWAKRERTAKWFSLIGQIAGSPRTQFDIGQLIENNVVYLPPTSGLLYCFANDAWLMYWNNAGSIELDVQAVV
jgi:hypothetical protein